MKGKLKLVSKSQHGKQNVFVKKQNERNSEVFFLLQGKMEKARAQPELHKQETTTTAVSKSNTNWCCSTFPLAQKEKMYDIKYCKLR
jgi:hypothetical protein